MKPAYPRWNTYINEKMDELTKPCEYWWERMYVWFDGKVNPCDADYKSYLSYGNVKENTIKDIWNSNKLKIIENNIFLATEATSHLVTDVVWLSNL